MKKVIMLASALACLASASAANATQIVIQPTLITGEPAYVAAPVVEPVIVGESVAYPVHHDHHHHYDWRYWQEHHDRDYDHR